MEEQNTGKSRKRILAEVSIAISISLCLFFAIFFVPRFFSSKKPNLAPVEIKSDSVASFPNEQVKTPENKPDFDTNNIEQHSTEPAHFNYPPPVMPTKMIKQYSKKLGIEGGKIVLPVVDDRWRNKASIVGWSDDEQYVAYTETGIDDELAEFMGLYIVDTETNKIASKYERTISYDCSGILDCIQVKPNTDYRGMECRFIRN